MTAPTAETLADGLRSVLGDSDLSDEIKVALLNQQFEREKFQATQALERRRWLYSTPVAIALAGGITILLNWYFASLSTDQQSGISAQSAAQQFQYGILERELEKDQTAEERADVLLFLARAGLLDDLNVDYLIEVAQSAPESIPQLGRIDRATAGALGRVYDVDDIIDVILRFEGGYVEHPDDPDGATNMGISNKTLAAWRGEPVTREDMRDLTEEEVRTFYRDIIARSGAERLDNIFVQTAYVNAAMNAGAGRAVRVLQALVGEDQDGERRASTFAKVNAMARENERETVIRFNCQMLAFYQGLQHWDTFGRGWTRRLAEITPGGSMSVCSDLE